MSDGAFDCLLKYFRAVSLLTLMFASKQNANVTSLLRKEATREVVHCGVCGSFSTVAVEIIIFIRLIITGWEADLSVPAE